MGNLSKFIHYYTEPFDGNTKTETGSVVSFVSDRERPFRSLSALMEPVQDVSDGPPSPDNICPITGWTSASAVVSPTTEESDGTAYSVSWESDVGTVYGGEVDIVSGLLSVQWVEVDIENVEIALNGHITDSVDEILLKVDNRFPGNSNNNMRSNVFANGTVTVPYTFMYSGDYGIYLHIPTLESYTAEAARGALLDLETQIVYKTKVPVYYQLTPTEITALLGQNYVWSDTGSVRVRYTI